MTDNMKRLAEQYKRRVEQEQNSRIAMDRRRQLLLSKSAQAWSDLRGCIKAAIYEFNRALGPEFQQRPHLIYDEPTIVEFSVRRSSDGKRLKGEFKQEDLIAEFRSQPDGSIQTFYRLALTDADEASFASFDRTNSTQVFHSCEEIAEAIVANFVNLP